MASRPTRQHFTAAARDKWRCASQKVCYPDKVTALDAAEAMMEDGRVKPGCHITPYECPDCGQWHVTNRVIIALRCYQYRTPD